MDAYVKFVESSGARVVPLIYHTNIEETLEKIEHLNGILFCGGSADDDLDYKNFGKAIFEKVKKMNDEGNYFPLWGTCLGFENFA